MNQKELIELIRKAGGVCSLAHPHTVNDLEKSINDLYENGLVGMEIVENKKMFATKEKEIKFNLYQEKGRFFPFFKLKETIICFNFLHTTLFETP